MSEQMDVVERVARALAREITEPGEHPDAHMVHCMHMARAAIAALRGEPVAWRSILAKLVEHVVDIDERPVYDTTPDGGTVWLRVIIDDVKAARDLIASPAMPVAEAGNSNCVCGNDGTALHDISCPAAISPSNEALVKALRDLAYCDESAENVENAEALAARVRRVARQALVQFGDKGDEPAALKSAMEE